MLINPIFHAQESIIPQDFITPNYSPENVPYVGMNMLNLAASASPLIGQFQPVHTAPVTYQLPARIAQVLGGIGFPFMNGKA